MEELYTLEYEYLWYSDELREHTIVKKLDLTFEQAHKIAGRLTESFDDNENKLLDIKVYKQENE